MRTKISLPSLCLFIVLLIINAVDGTEVRGDMKAEVIIRPPPPNLTRILAPPLVVGSGDIYKNIDRYADIIRIRLREVPAENRLLLLWEAFREVCSFSRANLLTPHSILAFYAEFVYEDLYQAALLYAKQVKKTNWRRLIELMERDRSVFEEVLLAIYSPVPRLVPKADIIEAIDNYMQEVPRYFIDFPPPVEQRAQFYREVLREVDNFLQSRHTSIIDQAEPLIAVVMASTKETVDKELSRGGINLEMLLDLMRREDDVLTHVVDAVSGVCLLDLNLIRRHLGLPELEELNLARRTRTKSRASRSHKSHSQSKESKSSKPIVSKQASIEEAATQLEQYYHAILTNWGLITGLSLASIGLFGILIFLLLESISTRSRQKHIEPALPKYNQ